MKPAKDSLRKQCGTGILKVFHGNIKSPTCCMYSWRYNILLEVKESSFKGGYSDFFTSHRIRKYMKKRYKSFIIKNYEITRRIF